MLKLDLIKRLVLASIAVLQQVQLHPNFHAIHSGFISVRASQAALVLLANIVKEE